MATDKREFIDPKELMRYINDNHSFAGLPMAAHICTMELLTYAPRVDAVEVVRCKDCKYRIFDEVTKEWFCNSWHSGFVYVKPNDFCSYGERKCPDE